MHDEDKSKAELIRELAALREQVESLQLADTKLQAILYGLGDAVLIIDRTGRYVDVPLTQNPTNIVPRQEIIGKNVHDFSPGPQAEQFLSYIQQVLKTGEPLHVEYALDLAGTKTFWNAIISPYIEDQVLWVARDVTRRKAMEEYLRESERRYRQYVEDVSDVFYTADMNGYCTYANESAQRLTGYSQQEIVGMHFFQLVPPDWHQRVLEFYQDQMKNQIRETTFEFPMLTQQGERKWVQQSLTLLLDDHKITGFQCIVRDITERKEMEERLRESEDRYRLINDLITDYAYMSEISPEKGRIFHWVTKENFYKLTGYRFDELDDPNQVYHPDDYPRVMQDIEKTRSGASAISGEYRVITKSGEVRWLNMHRRMKQDKETGNIRVFGAGQDITERKRAEESEYQQRIFAETLRDIANILSSTLEFDHVLEQILANVGRVTPYDTANIMLIDGKTARIARATGYEKWGVDLEELQSAQFFDVTIRPHFKKMIETGLPDIIPDVLEFDDWEGGKFAGWIRSHVGIPIRTAEETIGFLNLDSATPGFFSEEHVSSLQVFADQTAVAIRNARLFEQAEDVALILAEANRMLQSEIAEREKAEEALIQAKDEAEAANNAKSIFLSNMSHELRTPLNAILGFAQLLLTDTLTEKQHKQVETMFRSGEHLLEIINDILEISRIEAGRTEINPVDFDVFELVLWLEEMFIIQASEKQLSLDFEVHEDVPHFLHADSGKIRQILINIIRNAIKFTSSGRIRVLVNHQPTPFPDRIRLVFTVQDTGIGIREEELERLFQPFWQATHYNQLQQGTGLGLTIVKQFLDHMGGEIRVESQWEVGSTFIIEIPALITHELEDVGTLAQIVGVESAAQHRILIVDDEPYNRAILSALMQRMGFEVHECTNGQEALEKWEQVQPNLIWMDMRMPVMDGYEATRRIKGHPDYKDTRIIAITASAFENEKAKILKNGCDDYIAKPFQNREIFDVLKRHLDIEFIYKTHESNSVKAAPLLENLDITQLTSLTPSLAEKLRKAALLSDVTAVKAVISEVYEKDSLLSSMLSSWLRTYQFGKILDLVEEWEESHKPENNIGGSGND